jgi:NAD(P)-dependent dehydrogenase (short-subunit alcohol dehydrogenase family)
VYGAAKAGLNTLSRTMALEWSGHGIRVNVVAPGKMVVPRQARLGRAAPGQPQSYEDALAKPVPNEDIPLRRMGTAGDIGSAILFLLSDLASYVTGQVLSVDGGLNVKSVLTGPAARTL